MAALVHEVGQPLPHDAINGSDWSLTDAATAARLRRMRASGIPLGEYVKGRIYRGVLTGFNKAFVIDGAKREELISQDPRSAEIIKPLATGRDIKKWAVDYKDKWLIVTPIGVNMKRYPAILAHLSQWQSELETRYDKGRHWWELRACDYYAEFNKPKILYQEIATYQAFAFDSKSAFTNNKVFMIPDADFYLFGILNSSAAWQYFNNVCSKLSGGALAMQTPYVFGLPIPDAPAADREAIAALVQKCLDAKGVGCEEWEKEIDGRAAALYGL